MAEELEETVPVAEITLWSGKVYYTDNLSTDHIRDFIARALEVFEQERHPAADARPGMIEVKRMTESKYQELRKQQPVDAALLFGEKEDVNVETGRGGAHEQD